MESCVLMCDSFVFYVHSRDINFLFYIKLYSVK